MVWACAAACWAVRGVLLASSRAASSWLCAVYRGSLLALQLCSCVLSAAGGVLGLGAGLLQRGGLGVKLGQNGTVFGAHLAQHGVKGQQLVQAFGLCQQPKRPPPSSRCIARSCSLQTARRASYSDCLASRAACAASASDKRASSSVCACCTAAVTASICPASSAACPFSDWISLSVWACCACSAASADCAASYSLPGLGLFLRQFALFVAACAAKPEKRV